MKTFFKSKYLKIVICFLLIISMGLCFVVSPQASQSFASSTQNNTPQTLFVEEVLSDGTFTMTMTGSSRKKNVALYHNKQTVITETGDSVTYLCFNWRDLQSLTFNISANLSGSQCTFTNVKLQSTFLQSELLTKPLGVANPELLSQFDIINNSLSSFNFNYYIDSNNNATETNLRANGNDFGLYKFDCIYTYTQNDQSVSVSTGKLGGIYVAVLPDKVEPNKETKILYSISSSNKLMNVFNLYLSSDNYDYVNPENLEWVVIGIDKEKNQYVLTKQIKEANMDSYSNYRYIYESLDSNNGKNFIFDSKDIEGTWTAYCIITNSDGTITTLQVSNLSTIKKEVKSYIWLILLIIGITILLAGIIVLIVFRLKHDKVW